VSAKRHIARVRQVPCVLCEMLDLGPTPAEAHHAFDGAARSDYLTIALCHSHHRGPLGFHGLGEREFNRRYKTTEANLLALTLEKLS
jgi:hypothetical protein